MSFMHRVVQQRFFIVFAAFLALVCTRNRTVRAIDIQEQLNLSGYGNWHAMDHSGVQKLVGRDNINDLFYQLREFSLFFDFDVTEGVIASLELEAGRNGSRVTPNYGYVEFDVPTFYECWDEEKYGTFNVRVGRILVPFLWYNENKPNYRQILMSPPFTAQNFAPVIPLPDDFFGLGWTDSGVMADWTKEVKELDGFFNLKIAVIDGLGSDSNVLDSNFVQLEGGPQPFVRPRDGLRENEQDIIRDRNDNVSTVLKATFARTDVPVDVGFSWYRGKWNPNGDKNLQMWGLHANWLARNWTLKGEFAWAYVEQDAGILLNPLSNPPPVPAPPNPAGLNTSTGNYDMMSWYLEGSYVLVRWGEDSERFLRGVARYDIVDTNNQVGAFNPFHRNRYTFGMEIQIAAGARLRYEWQYHTLLEIENAPAPFVLAGGEKHVKMHMASVIFYF